MAADPVFTEILSNRFRGIANEMAYTIQRTAFSVFVKETQDYVAGLVSLGGEVFGFPDSAPPMLLGSNLRRALAAVDSYEPGDVVMANDPHSTGGLMTQVNDLNVWKPFFYDGKLICFLWDFLHLSDVGGSVPGSITLSNSEIAQEGTRFPPVKLYRRDELVADVAALFRANTRTPNLNWGDLNALLSALKIGERRLADTVNRYGLSAVAEGIEGVLRHGEARSRRIIHGLPDGRYDAADYLEFKVAGRPIRTRIQLALSISDGSMKLDFRGTGSQQPAAVNLVTAGKRHADVVYGVINFLRTVDPTVPLNGGILRPLRVNLPAGTILNPRGAPAIGGRMATVLRVMDVVNASLGRAAPSMVPAASGDPTLIFMAVPGGTARRGPSVSLLQPLAGGYGARMRKDGVDGADAGTAWLRNVPTETLETALPIIVTQYRLDRRISHGRHRGGRGTVFEFKVLETGCQIIARNRTRIAFRPWGLAGGEPGGIASVSINPDSPAQDERDVLDVYVAQKGDVIRFRSSRGAAFGSPLKRDPDAVLRDVLAGLLTPAGAVRDYGVIIRQGRVGWAVDSKETKKERQRVGKVINGPTVSWGLERLLADAGVPASSCALASRIRGLPAWQRVSAMEAVGRRLPDIPMAADSSVEGLWLKVKEDLDGGAQA